MPTQSAGVMRLWAEGVDALEAVFGYGGTPPETDAKHAVHSLLATARAWMLAPSASMTRREHSQQETDSSVPRDLLRMALPTGTSDLVAAVVAALGQSHRGDAGEARPILHSVRPAGRSAQGEPVQGRPAARLQIWLGPHGGCLSPGWQVGK